MGEEVNKKFMYAIRSRTIREIVDKVNELKVPREDVVTILQENGFYIMIYYYKRV